MNDEFKIELRNELLNTMQSLCERILQREQAANVSTHTPDPSRRFNIIYDYNDDDDDDEESTIPLNEITSQIPLITPVLLTMEPEDSLIMGDEDLSTIPKKESDEFIKSSVEDLIPTLKDIESEDSYVSKLDEPDLLVTPLFKLNEDECFDLGGDVDEIELLLHRDPSTPKISVASILEGFTDEPPLVENDDFY
ncbi:hypothetical protein Tco_0831386 [Tanacetum coccineum]